MDLKCPEVRIPHFVTKSRQCGANLSELVLKIVDRGSHHQLDFGLRRHGSGSSETFHSVKQPPATNSLLLCCRRRIGARRAPENRICWKGATTDMVFIEPR